MSSKKYLGSYSGITIQDDTGQTRITSSYCSGVMPQPTAATDIKGAWLADTTAESLTSVGWSYDFTTDTTGDWTLTPSLGGGITYDGTGDQLVLTCTTSGNAGVYKALTTVVGKTYVVGMEHTNGAGATGWYARAGTATSGVSAFDLYNSGDLTSATSHVFSFTATTTTSYITLTGEGSATAVHNMPSVSVDLADPDRSVNGNGLQVNGTITKSAVATGAELMAYSGFSASNYLEQPYNADLDFGTGDFYVMGWAYFTSSGTYGGLIDRVTDKTPASLGGHALMFICGGSNFMQAYINGTNLIGTAGSCPNNSWVFCTLVRKDGIATIYINGRYDASMSAPATVTDTTATTTVGAYWYNNIPQADLWKIGLVRIGAGAPTASDISFIYNQEKPLFQPNSKCTLADNDSVSTMSWNEYKQLLYVDDGVTVSKFSGLKRVGTLTSGSAAKIASESIYEVQG